MGIFKAAAIQMRSGKVPRRNVADFEALVREAAGAGATYVQSPEMTGAIIRDKQDRIGARVPHEVYETLCRAAELTGATVNQFLVQAALKEAQEVIEREAVIRLSPRDWNWLLDLMENPAKPNAKLKAALKRYQQAKRDDADTVFNWEP